MNRISKTVLLGGAAFVAVMAGTATAQEAAGAPAETRAASPGASDIIVTAQRREERAQDVPVVVTAFSAERLEQLNVTKPQDLYGTVPSLVVGNQGTAVRDAQSFTIRGQATGFLSSPAVVQYLSEVPLPAATTVGLQGAPGLFVDMQNVQVLSGPQGTLFGRNTTGGAVLFQPQKPTNNLEGYFEGSVGNYELRTAEGAINIPIVDDVLMVRVVGAYNDRRGYTKDLVWNKWRDDTHWYSGRIGVTFKPTERIENYLLVYGSKSSTNGAGYIHQGFNTATLASRGSCTNGTPVPGGPVSCAVYTRQTQIAQEIGPRRVRDDLDAFSDISTWGGINNTSVELTDELTLRNIVSYQKLKVNYGTDQDGTPLQQYELSQGADVPNFPVAGLVEYGLPRTAGNVFLNGTGPFDLPRDHIKQFTEELQLQGTMLDNHLTFALGGFYFDAKPDELQGSISLQFCAAHRTGTTACQPSHTRTSIRNKSKALYGQATLDFGAVSPSLENLRLTAGYRYTWDRISGFAAGWSRSDDPRPSDPDTLIDDITCSAGAPAGTIYDNVTDGTTLCAFNATLKSKAPTWTIGLDYKPFRNVMLYAKVSRGYKSGGINSASVRAETTIFQPEKLTTYEAGFKSDWNLGSVPLRLNATYYYSDYSNIHRPGGDFNLATGAGGARIFAASATIQGVEVEASVRPIEGVEIGGTMSHADGDYKNYTVSPFTGGLACNGAVGFGGTADFSCAPFQFLTPWIYNIHASIDLPMPADWGGLSLFASYSHVSSQYTAPRPFEPGAELEGYGLLNASLTWKGVGGRGLDVSLFGTNLTDKLYRVSSSNVFGSNLVSSSLYGEPRMYGLKVKYRFGGE